MTTAISLDSSNATPMEIDDGPVNEEKKPIFYTLIRGESDMSKEDYNRACEDEKKSGHVEQLAEAESWFYPTIVNALSADPDNSANNPLVIKQFTGPDSKLTCLNEYNRGAHFKFMRAYAEIWKNDFKEQGCEEIEKVSNFKDYVKNAKDQALIEEYVKTALLDKARVDALYEVMRNGTVNYDLTCAVEDAKLLKEKKDRKKLRRVGLKAARERRWIVENEGNPDNAEDCKRIGLYPPKAYPIPFDKEYIFAMWSLKDIIEDVDEKINVDPIEVKEETKKEYQAKQVSIYIINELIQTVAYFGNDILRNKLYGYIASLLNNINFMEFALATGEPFYRFLDKEVRENFDADNQKLLETKISYPINLEDTDTERDDLPTPEQLEAVLYQIKAYNERMSKKKAAEAAKAAAAIPPPLVPAAPVAPALLGAGADEADADMVAAEAIADAADAADAAEDADIAEAIDE